MAKTVTEEGKMHAAGGGGPTAAFSVLEPRTRERVSWFFAAMRMIALFMSTGVMPPLAASLLSRPHVSLQHATTRSRKEAEEGAT
jgi:hypothetical protein